MSGTSGEPRITDLHSHVIPGVDDGAQDLEEALAALRTLVADGVGRVVATPHFRASLLERPAREAETLDQFDFAFELLYEAVVDEGIDIQLERGCEFKLDAPTADLSDPRLRLAGSSYALVEFSSFQLPPYAGNQLLAVRDAGWAPLLAHPERYAGVTSAWDRVERWVREGTLLQVNARSLLGWYGAEPQLAARELLRLGWVTCLASDYHSRGRPDFGAALDLLRESRVVGSDESALTGSADPPPADGTHGQAVEARDAAIARLVSVNPEHMLGDRPPEPVQGLDVPHVDRRSQRRGWFR